MNKKISKFLKKLAIVTVNFENYKVTEEFLDCFKSQTSDNFKIFVADFSTQKKNLSSSRYLEVINGENRGYAYGVNLGLHEAVKQGFDKFCVINNDTYLKSDFVDRVVESVIHHSSSIIGGKIYYAPGYEYHKGRHQQKDLGKVIWYAGGEIDWDNALIKHRGVDEINRREFDKFEKTEFITGCLMLFDKRVIEKVGFWDDGYFLYYEDVDYCIRATKKGIKLYYDPSIVIWHKNAQSTGGSGSKLHQKYQQRSRLKFGLKYAPLKTKFHLVKNFLFAKLKIK